MAAKHRRTLTTTHTETTPIPPRPPGSSSGTAKTVGLIITASLASGLAGYSLSQTRQTTSTKHDAFQPMFGSEQDFKEAVKELEASFPEGAVTTDIEDLRTHGILDGDYHPGK